MPATSRLRRLLVPGVRSLSMTALLTHALAAGLWWWAMPHGFGPGHARFWLNTALPPAVVATTLAAAVLLWRGRRPAVAAVLLAMAAAWASAGLTAWAAFPRTFGRFADFAMPAALGLLVLALCQARTWWSAAGVPAGLLAGVGSVLAVAPPPPTTLPAGGDLATLTPGDGTARLTGGGAIRDGRGRVFVQLDPLLTFISRSPDGGWTCFAGPDDRLMRRTGGPTSDHAGRWVDRYALPDREVADVKRVELSATPDGFTAATTAEVEMAVPSHLNSFATLFLDGAGDGLTVTFSPCPDAPVAVTSSDYPAGRPARFTALLPNDRFVVVEATSAEKGPFRVLAEGPLRRGDPLTLTFADENGSLAAWTLHGFSGQASTEPSPTAGWGMPQNAVRFERTGPGSLAVFVTLAGTGVGRGYDTVTHAAGTYTARHDWRWLTGDE